MSQPADDPTAPDDTVPVTDDTPNDLPTAEWITLAEAAKRVGKTTRTIRRHVAAGKISTRRAGEHQNSPLLVNWSHAAKVYGIDTDTVKDRPTADSGTVLMSDWLEMADRVAKAESRAATAETTVQHLRERLAELRNLEDELRVAKDEILTKRQRRRLARLRDEQQRDS